MLADITATRLFKALIYVTHQRRRTIQTLRFSACMLGYFALFVVFEYINARNMTSGSWKEIIRFGLRPAVLLFFACCPILVWGFNKELFEFIGCRFWYTGVIMAGIEFAAYIAGSYLFYRTLPSPTEAIALAFVLTGIVIGATQVDTQQ